MLSTLSSALLIIAAVTRSANPYSLPHHQHPEPCAELSRNRTSAVYVNAELALACLRSVPLQPPERLRMQLAGLRTFVQFQSDLEYLNSSDFPARLYPSVDILGGLHSLERRLNGSYYDNEYDFQLDISRLIASAYDSHFQYFADIANVFHFQRGAPEPYPLVSVSSDGREIPAVYAARDAARLAGGHGDISSISRINGQDAVNFLQKEAAMTGTDSDPDANFNGLFQQTDTNYTVTDDGQFATPEKQYFGTGNGTTLTFSNGSMFTVETVAIPSIALSGISNGKEFFRRCCSGSRMLRKFEHDFNEVKQEYEESSVDNVELRDRIKTLVGPRIASPESRSRATTRSDGGQQVDSRAAATEYEQLASGGFSTDDGSLIGYFPDTDPDLAVLALTTFEVGVNGAGTMDDAGLQVLQDYLTKLLSFIDAAGEANKTRLIIDLRGNREKQTTPSNECAMYMLTSVAAGGLVYLTSQVFRFLFPTTGIPYLGNNLRAHDLLDFAGQAATDLFSSPSATSLKNVRSVLARFGLDGAKQLDESNSTFETWSNFFGPVQVPSIDGNFTSIITPNYNDRISTYPFNLTRPLTGRRQVFDAENIVLLQDGMCASACAYFVEFMKTSAPNGPARQFVVGGRPQTGPMQGVGGIKGGMLGRMHDVGSVFRTVVELNSSIYAEFEHQFGRETIPGFLEAWNRGAMAAVNGRNSIREGDESVTPLQYIYEAAECRLFYTADTLRSAHALWRRVAKIAFDGGDDACVEGSTGHPSTAGGTHFADVDVPQNGASSFAIRMSGSNAGGVGRNNGGDEGGN